MPGIERLSDFPWVTVRIECQLCPHGRGSYRLARLAATFGVETMLTKVLDRIAFDCPGRTPPGERPRDQYDPKCKARFTDLDRVSPPSHYVAIVETAADRSMKSRSLSVRMQSCGNIHLT
jgi:hypothetical protein